ncbi:MAG TPA: FixH family protein [Calditrichia bacterium]|nr:FixH family protein [Calditrichota bacterium]HQU71728.1 FixH family protein [Calditrichia bacterium]HQV33922.1 FixH family protein [Calditrichia bacterium]
MAITHKDNIWPMAITGVLVLFVGFLIAFLLFAANTPVNLVNEDYYRKGVDYQTQIERIERTQQLNEPMGLVFQGDHNALLVSAAGDFPVTEQQGEVTLLRPSDATQDIRIRLKFDESGHHLIPLQHLSRGLWRAQLNWNANSAEYYQELVFSIR